MSDWRSLIEDEGGKKNWSRKINKDVYCKKNKIGGGRYGQHIYEQDSKYCKLCGHTRNKRRTQYE